MNIHRALSGAQWIRSEVKATREACPHIFARRRIGDNGVDNDASQPREPMISDNGDRDALSRARVDLSRFIRDRDGNVIELNANELRGTLIIIIIEGNEFVSRFRWNMIIEISGAISQGFRAGFATSLIVSRTLVPGVPSSKRRSARN